MVLRSDIKGREMIPGSESMVEGIWFERGLRLVIFSAGWARPHLDEN